MAACTDILNNFGGVDNNNLLNLVQMNIPDVEDINGFLSSPYFLPDELTQTALIDKSNYFTILSLNCQSLNAKFDQILILIENLKTKF